MFGWDGEQKLPWRKAVSAGKHSLREMAVEVKIAPNSEPTDAVLGVWADGCEHIVAEVTVGDWEHMQASLGNDKQRGKTGALWRGQTSEGT
eukprot:13861665-Alexandrium_andersonii.AAC.1